MIKFQIFVISFVGDILNDDSSGICIVAATARVNTGMWLSKRCVFYWWLIMLNYGHFLKLEFAIATK